MWKQLRLNVLKTRLLLPMRYILALVGFIWTCVGGVRFYNLAQQSNRANALVGMRERSLESLLTEHGHDLWVGLAILVIGCIVALMLPKRRAQVVPHSSAGAEAIATEHPADSASARATAPSPRGRGSPGGVFGLLCLALVLALLAVGNSWLTNSADYQIARERSMYGYATQDVPQMVSRRASEEDQMLRGLEEKLDKQLEATSTKRVAPMTLVGSEPIQTPDGPTMGVVMETSLVAESGQQTVLQVVVGSQRLGPAATQGSGYARLSRTGPVSRGSELRALLEARGFSVRGRIASTSPSTSTTSPGQSNATPLPPADPLLKEASDLLQRVPADWASHATEVASRLALCIWMAGERDSALEMLASASRSHEQMLRQPATAGDGWALGPFYAALIAVKGDDEALTKMESLDSEFEAQGLLLAAHALRSKPTNKHSPGALALAATQAIAPPRRCEAFDERWELLLQLAEVVRDLPERGRVNDAMLARLPCDELAVQAGGRDAVRDCSARISWACLVGDLEQSANCIEHLLHARLVEDPWWLLSPARQARLAGQGALGKQLLRCAQEMLGIRRHAENEDGVAHDAIERIETDDGYAALAEELAWHGDVDKAIQVLRGSCNGPAQLFAMVRIAEALHVAGRQSDADNLVKELLTREKELVEPCNRVSLLKQILVVCVEPSASGVSRYSQCGGLCVRALDELAAKADPREFRRGQLTLSPEVWKKVPRDLWPKVLFESLDQVNQCRALMLSWREQRRGVK